METSVGTTGLCWMWTGSKICFSSLPQLQLVVVQQVLDKMPGFNGEEIFWQAVHKFVMTIDKMDEKRPADP